MNIKYSQFGTWAPKCVSEEQQAVWKDVWKVIWATTHHKLIWAADADWWGSSSEKDLECLQRPEGEQSTKVWLIGKQLNDSTLNRQREWEFNFAKEGF